MPGTLLDIKWRNPDGRWTAAARRHGSRSDRDFVNNPDAQEAALDAAFGRYEDQAKAKRLFDRVGQKVRGLKGDITITDAGLMAAIHRHGATGTWRYFQKLDRAGGDSNKMMPTQQEREIETRLRTFEGAVYRRMKP